MHALIVGDRGVGKSTLIRRVLKELNRPLFGFETKKEEQLEDPLRGCPIYIYDAGKPHITKSGTFRPSLPRLTDMPPGSWKRYRKMLWWSWMRSVFWKQNRKLSAKRFCICWRERIR